MPVAGYLVREGLIAWDLSEVSELEVQSPKLSQDGGAACPTPVLGAASEKRIDSPACYFTAAAWRGLLRGVWSTKSWTQNCSADSSLGKWNAGNANKKAELESSQFFLWVVHPDPVLYPAFGWQETCRFWQSTKMEGSHYFLLQWALKMPEQKQKKKNVLQQ